MSKFIKIPLLALLLSALALCSCRSQEQKDPSVAEKDAIGLPVVFGAEVLIRDELQSLRGKRIGIVANHTSRVFDRSHLVDSLLSYGIEVDRIFSPEHGFRGNVDRGMHIQSGADVKTGLPVISLYGENKKPTAEVMEGLDLVLFDLQDVGARHYTYLSTMCYVMERCAEAGIPFWVLDRPNPNGWYVDGPVMEAGFTSFSGMHVGVPIVHGMTAGEYAQMVNEEGWLANGVKAGLRILKAENYDHAMQWEDTQRSWLPPSPNLSTPQAAFLYPALVWYERTIISVGRGTDSAFLMVGANYLENWLPEADWDEFGLVGTPLSFVPRKIPGKASYPKFEGERVFALKFENRTDARSLFLSSLSLLSQWQKLWAESGEEQPFFLDGFDRWAGSEELRRQVEGQELSVEEIYQNWQEGIAAFRSLRSRYLLYPEGN